MTCWFVHCVTWAKHSQIVAVTILLATYLEALAQFLALGDNKLQKVRLQEITFAIYACDPGTLKSHGSVCTRCLPSPNNASTSNMSPCFPLTTMSTKMSIVFLKTRYPYWREGKYSFYS